MTHCPLEAGSWLDVGTTMSVEFDTTPGAGLLLWAALNLEQPISLAPSPHAFTLFYIESGSSEDIVLSLPACAANAMQRAEDFVL